MDCLAAGSAGLAGGGVEVGDGDGADAYAGTAKSDGSGDGGLFGAGGEPVGGVFDVATGDDSTVRQQEGGTDTEVAIGCIGVKRDGDGLLMEIGDLCGSEAVGVFDGGHDVSEAIGCGE